MYSVISPYGEIRPLAALYPHKKSFKVYIADLFIGTPKVESQIN